MKEIVSGGVVSLYNFIIAALAISLLVLPTASFAAGDDNAEANRKMVDIIRNWESYDALRGDESAIHKERVVFLENIINGINDIIENNSGSDVALELILNDGIGPISKSKIHKSLHDSNMIYTSYKCKKDHIITRECIYARLWDRAVGDDGELNSVKFGRIAMSQANNEMFDDALNTASYITGSWLTLVLREISYELAVSGDISRSLQVAYTIESAVDRAMAIALISAEGDSQALASDALETVDGLDATQARKYALSIMGIIAVSQEDSELLTEIYNKINAPQSLHNKQEVLSTIAFAQSRYGVAGEALLTAEQIEDVSRRASALYQISMSYYWSGDKEKSIEVANSINEPSTRARILRDIAKEENDEELFSLAMNVAERIESEENRTITISSIIASLNNKKSHKEAISLARSLPSAAKDLALVEIANQLPK